MQYSISENKSSYKDIHASIFDDVVLREERAYVDYDKDSLIIKSVLTFKNHTEEKELCNANGPKIKIVTEMEIPSVVLDIDGIIVDDSVESTMRLFNDNKDISVPPSKTTEVRDMYNEGFLFSKEYSKLIGMFHIRNKRISSITKKLYQRKFNWSIDYEVSSKVYTSTVKANVSYRKDSSLESYTMYIEEATHVYTHISATDLIDELLAVPYTFHGTSINYSSRDYTTKYGRFVVGNITSKIEANRIVQDICDKTNNIARYLI